MDRMNKLLILMTTLMQIVESSRSCASQSTRRVIHAENLSIIPRWSHSSHGAALVVPLSSSTSSSSLDHYQRRSLSTLNNVRTKLSDGLARHGYYTSTVYIGSPPQAFAMIVDTGSTITYVPCSSCSHCGSHQDPSFKPEESNSFSAIHCDDGECEMGSCVRSTNLCTYARHYAEQSFSSGFLARDYVRYGTSSSGYSPRPLVFGCETSESGDLYSQRADGIMGLGRGSLSVIDQLIVQGAIASTFSLCYGGMDEDGGAMILGAVPPMDEMVFTPSNPSRSFYYNIVLKEIWVQGKPLPVEPGVFDGRYGTVLDSGTTFAYLPEKAFNVFKDAFVHGVKDLEEIDGPDANFKDICYSGAGTDPDNLSAHFPPIDLVFGDDKTVSLAAENYLFRHTTHPGAYCLGFFQNEDSTTILGGIVTRNVLVTYDRENDQIGFLRTKCADLWRTLLESPASGNDSSIPPVGMVRADTDNVGIRPPPMPVVYSHSPNRSSAPGVTSPQAVKNHSDSSDVISQKDVDTSDASSSRPFLFTVRSFRHLRMPSMHNVGQHILNLCRERSSSHHPVKTGSFCQTLAKSRLDPTDSSRAINNQALFYDAKPFNSELFQKH